MLKYYNFDIVFAEVPDEVSLAINITNCPNHCVGCHSPHLLQDIGTVLDETELRVLLDEYKKDVTCVCFMGGDAEPVSVENLAKMVKREYPTIKTAWYSGKSKISEAIAVTSFDYIKIGGYDDAKGPLNNPGTNQKMFSVDSEGNMTDVTSWFWKK